MNSTSSHSCGLRRCHPDSLGCGTVALPCCGTFLLFFSLPRITQAQLYCPESLRPSFLYALVLHLFDPSIHSSSSPSSRYSSQFGPPRRVAAISRASRLFLLFDFYFESLSPLLVVRFRVDRLLSTSSRSKRSFYRLLSTSSRSKRSFYRSSLVPLRCTCVSITCFGIDRTLLLSVSIVCTGNLL